MGNVFSYAWYINLGVDPDLSAHTQDGVRGANRAAFMGAILSLAFAIVTFAGLPAVAPLMISATAVYLILPTLHLLRLTTSMRIITALLLPIVVYIIHVSLLVSHQAPIAGITAIQVACLLLPFLIFSAREKSLLFLILAISALLLLLAQAPVLIIGIEKNTVSVTSINYCTFSAALLLFVWGSYILLQHQTQILAVNEQLSSALASQKAEFSETQNKLNKYISETELSQHESQQRQWASDGIALFADILRRQDTVDLYDKLICQLVKYLKVNQGGLFLVKDEEGHTFLELVACYAYNRKKYINKRIEVGQGLLGQCMLEKDIIHLTEIPQDYVQITSGLGNANPASILILPLKVNETVIGVIELASFNKFKPFEIEFLLKISESIAASVSNVKINQRTRELLEQFQAQTEEIHAQKEEMRQNIEELEATQEEMRRIQERLQLKDQESQQTVIELTNIRNELEAQLTEKLQESECQKARTEVFLKTATDAILFMDENASITACNAATEIMFSYKAEELTGKSLSLLLQLPGEENLIAHIQENIKSRRSNWVEYTGKSKMYGSQIPIELCLTVGEVNGESIYVTMIRDITKRKKAETDMQKNLVKFQDLQKSMQESQMKMNALKTQLKEKEDLLAAKEEELKTLKN